MQIPIVGFGKKFPALQHCKSARAAVTIWQSGYLAQRPKECYMGFARNEHNLISP
jgi:hypothetical protein